jgi:hypothetical protein
LNCYYVVRVNVVREWCVGGSAGLLLFAMLGFILYIGKKTIGDLL